VIANLAEDLHIRGGKFATMLRGWSRRARKHDHQDEHNHNKT